MRIHHAFFLERVNGSARVFDHAAHLRPVRITIVEGTRLAHSAPKPALIEREDCITGAHESQYGMQIVMVDPHVTELMTVSVKPDHHGKPGVFGRSRRVVKIASHVVAESYGFRGRLAL